MPSPEENTIALETLLDNSTLNFHRFIQTRVGSYNATALGAVCIGWGGYPSGGGAYHGFFDFHTNRNTTLLIHVDGLSYLDRNAVLIKSENGRGHTIRYMRTPENYRDLRAGLMSSECKLAKLGSEADIPIDDEHRPIVEEVIKDIKEGEFWTIRKYALGMNHSHPDLEEAVFKETVPSFFTDIPAAPRVVRLKENWYTILEMPGDNLVAMVDGTPLSIPATRLNLEKLGGFTVGKEINIRQMQIDANPDWTLTGVAYDALLPP
jgi:hypothetical protein